VVDQGFIVNAEYRWSVLPQLSLSGFYDWARGSFNKDPRADEENSIRLRGYGLGLYWSAPWGVSVRSSLAWRDTPPGRADTRDRNPRLFMQVVKTF
jgi:hemolysin activation/secretion protein